MCLNVTTRTAEECDRLAANPPVAKEEIKVYKLFSDDGNGGNLSSPYQNFPYKRNATYRSRMDIRHEKGSCHLAVEAGLHAYTNGVPGRTSMGIIIECIIPKGAKYLINHNGGEIAASAMAIPSRTGEIPNGAPKVFNVKKRSWLDRLLFGDVFLDRVDAGYFDQEDDYKAEYDATVVIAYTAARIAAGKPTVKPVAIVLPSGATAVVSAPNISEGTDTNEARKVIDALLTSIENEHEKAEVEEMAETY